MIDRRSFTLGMASLLAAGHALADDMGTAAPMPAKKKRRDIPFTPLEKIPNHRQFMRDIVVALSAYAKKRNPRFVVLVRNGPGLLVKETREWKWETLRDPDGADAYPKVGALNRPYLKAVDGMLIDGLSYGAPPAGYGKASSAATVHANQSIIDVLRREGRGVVAIDYCDAKDQVADAEAKAAKAGALAYVDRDGDMLLGRVPADRPRHENAAAVSDIAKARNFLPMLRSNSFATRAAWVDTLAATNYDLLMLDTFWRENKSLSFDQVKRLKYKRLGSDRLVLGVLPLALARDTRFYWKPEWKLGDPSFLVAPDPDDAAETVVNYWDDKWKEIIGLYMQGIVDLGVDGVLFDQVDAYLYFEDLMPLE